MSFSETEFLPSQVPADLQNEVLMSLLETDPDVVDYLLRRKASQYSWVSAFCLIVCVRVLSLCPSLQTVKIIIMNYVSWLPPGDIYCSNNIYCVFFVSAESQAFLEQKTPSPWQRDAYPMTPSKHLVERCLPMTTTPLFCQIDCCVNTQRTAVHSQTGSPDFLGSTNSVAILKTDLAAPLLHFLQTKVNQIHCNIYLSIIKYHLKE